MPTLIKATKQEYIAWVQRSLNRLPLGDTALITDGKDTSEYRDRVRAYKADKKLGKSDEVDAKVQNALIDGSHRAPEYVTWVQIALEKAVTHSGRAPTGKMDSATKTAIKSFQTYEGLGDDGWIGPDTETVLIERSGVFPPGHFGPIEAPPEEEAPAEQEQIPISVLVRGEVPFFLQKGVTCWAAAFAMMYGWKHGKKDIRKILDEAGDKGWWRRQFDFPSDERPVGRTHRRARDEAGAERRNQAAGKLGGGAGESWTADGRPGPARAGLDPLDRGHRLAQDILVSRPLARRRRAPAQRPGQRRQRFHEPEDGDQRREVTEAQPLPLVPFLIMA